MSAAKLACPPMTEAEARMHAVFMALMCALSFPGRPQGLPAEGLDALACVGESLLDLETSYFTPHPELERRLARTGARRLPVEHASYHFYPELHEIDVEHLRDALVGTYAYPDRSATLVVAANVAVDQSGSNGTLTAPPPGRTRLRLQGPGIHRPIHLLLGDVPRSFWRRREEAIRYPLGWDVLLVGDGHVVGLPRTTTIEVL